MARLTSSAPLSLSAIAAEFNASSLGDAGNAVNGGTGSIPISSFLGDGLLLGDQNRSETTTDGSTCFLEYTLSSAGGASINKNSLTHLLANWIEPGSSGVGAEYDAYVSITSGSLTSGTVGSWVNLGTSKTWRLERSTDGTSSVAFTVSIRRAGKAGTLASCSVTLSATYENPVSIAMTAHLISDFVIDPNNAYAGIEFNTSGQLYGRLGNATDSTYAGEWMDPAGGAPSSDYEVRATLSSGNTPSGPALGTWHGLGTTREWYFSLTAPASVSCDLLCEIKEISTGTIVASATQSLAATVDSNL